MDSGSDYLALQQPGPGYGPGAGSGAAANYLTQQSPAPAYAPGQGSGGGAVATAPKTTPYVLPDPETGPWSGHKGRVPHVSRLPLYIKANAPRPTEIRQQNIGNCYLAAALAALANTPSGRGKIVKMIGSPKGAITTVCHEWTSDNVKLDHQRKLNSNRRFTVQFKAKKVEVSDVLYHDDSDKLPNLMYMTTPDSDKALWAAIIEVAYAKLKGGYDNISLGNVTVNQFVEEFSAAKWTIREPDKDTDGIKSACKTAGTKPCFVATPLALTKKLTPWHGYAVLGMSGEKVNLWDPRSGNEEIAFSDLLTDVAAVITS